MNARRAVAAAAAVCACIAPTTADVASALFSATGGGFARARAGTVAVPSAPSIGSVGIVLIFCEVTVSWPAPPAGHQYAVIRTIGSTNEQIQAPTSAGGSKVDRILLSVLFGVPSYTIVSSRTGTAWKATSTPVTASGC